MTDIEFEAIISMRSYLIWEREGRISGHAHEYWNRALAEIEAELGLAPCGEDWDQVPPHLEISQKPVRRAA